MDVLLGNIRIYFGVVVDVIDNEKLYRCRVKIDALTDEIANDDLPWYFPFYGVNFLPQKNDVVGVIVFDENLSTAFYTKKLDNNDNISDGDYENYLELFKRSVDAKNVQLTYTKSKGIEFKNGDSSTTISLEKIIHSVGGMNLTISKNLIELGDGGQFQLMGDKSVSHFQNIILHQQNQINAMLQMFNAIASAANPNPFTLAIGVALTPLITSLVPPLMTENAKLNIETKTLQSTKVKNA